MSRDDNFSSYHDYRHSTNVQRGAGPNAQHYKRTLIKKRAVELRKEGRSYAEIADLLGITEAAAGRAVRESLKMARAAMQETAGEIVDVELARLDDMLQVHLRAARGGDVKSAELVLKIMDRRSRYLGLDQAVKLDVKQSAGELRLDNLSAEDLDKLEALALAAAGVVDTGQEADQLGEDYLDSGSVDAPPAANETDAQTAQPPEADPVFDYEVAEPPVVIEENYAACGGVDEEDLDDGQATG